MTKSLKLTPPQNPFHRCVSGEFDPDHGTSEFIIIELKDLTIPTDAKSNMYGAIEVCVRQMSWDETEVPSPYFFFHLMQDDDGDMKSLLEFRLGDDFDHHVRLLLRTRAHLRSMREAFGISLSADIDVVTEGHLDSVYLARCMADKIVFRADVSFSGRSVSDDNCFVEVTVRHPQSDRERRFRSVEFLDFDIPDVFK